MNNLYRSIENHYHQDNLYETIIDRLHTQGLDLDHLDRKDLSGVDEFHVRGAAVSKELASSVSIAGAKVLDIGCGLGGPARMLAQEFGCTVTGIDLSPEYIRTATALSRLVKLDHLTYFRVANATDLPFEGEQFRVIWTQHVQMNVPDKHRFYSEITRVLRPGGYFLYYDIFLNDEMDIEYPMPWASHANQSFLVKSILMDQVLSDAKCDNLTRVDQTAAGIAFFEGLLDRINISGPPLIGLHLLMGDSTKTKLNNLLTHLKRGALRLESGVYIKARN